MDEVGELSVKRWTPCLDRIQFHMHWVIPNFKSVCDGKKVGWYIQSPLYSLEDCKETEWQLSMNPRGHSSRKSEGFIGVYLNLRKCEEPILPVDHKFSVLTEMNMINYPLFSPFKPTIFERGSGKGNCKLAVSDIVLDEKNKLLPEGKLIILCEVTIESRFSEVIDDGVYSLLRDLSNLFHEQKLTDVTLKAKGGEIKAHKLVLSMRSPVFESMFLHDTAENITDSVEFTDITFEALSVMVHYIYHGTLRNIDDVDAIEQYLKAAEKYLLADFKVICGEKLFEKLSVENAVKTLLTADVYNCTILKNQVVEFISENIKDVIQTDEFKSSNFSSDLYKELLLSVVESKP